MPKCYVHMNAYNLAETIKAKGGKTVGETLKMNTDLVEEQAKRLKRRILIQLNHPNGSHRDITPEDAAAARVQFLEAHNGATGKLLQADECNPSSETHWDIVNTIRIAGMKRPPLYDVGSDDTHHFLPPLSSSTVTNATAGRAWIVVRAKQLGLDSLLDAMQRGDYYVSTGVVMRDVRYDAQKRTLSVDVKPEPGVKYVIEFIGTLEGADTTCTIMKPSKPSMRPGRKYSPEIGKVLSHVEGTSATYQLTGKELFVRAAIRSDRPAVNPSYEDQKQEAWTQPVGWENRVEPAKQ